MNITNTTREEVLRAFIAEDIRYGDITTSALVDRDKKAEGRVVCKERAVVAGVEEALVILELGGCHGTALVSDGEHVKPNTVILSVRGPARAMLAIERTLLNLLCHMSGVATATADLVSIAKKESHGKVRIASTRKTLPGLRYFEKRAVELGGGDTHRLGLDDEVLIKDNHIELTGSVKQSVREAKAAVSFTKKIEIECPTPEDAVEAAQAGADIVLLDNMTPEEVGRSVKLLRDKRLRDRLLIEASGGIRRENLAQYASTGVDVISVGAITHSARAIDVNMELQSSKSRR